MNDRNDLDERIRQRAYDIWRAQGGPHGRDQEHWEQARRELTSPGGEAVTAAEGKLEAELGAESAGAEEPSGASPGIGAKVGRTASKAGAATPAKARGRKRAGQPQSTAADAAKTAGETS